MNEITVRPMQIIQTMDDAERAANAMAKSGFFADTKQAAQAIVKILAGQELGFGPFASMTGVNIIQNKPVLAANLLAAAVKRTGKYNYRIVKHDETECDISFLEDGKEVGRSKFTMDDAKAAGVATKDNWKKYPRNMLFARAISNGQKWFAPDVFNGATVYTPDELGAVVDEDGQVVSVQESEMTEAQIASKLQKAIEAWDELVTRGVAVNEFAEPITPNMTIEELRAAYKELHTRVIAKEAK
ncbi:MAG: hypothetical protein WC714_28755 [Candidatus Obscuribacterales bacterium]|jgi:hypothetical protein